MAHWIAPVELDDGRRVHRPAYHLARSFQLDDSVAFATLHATALGMYEAFVNGQRVGDQELLPGFTAYRKRLQVHCFEVTELLMEGSNAVGFLLSDGRWRGQHDASRLANSFGEKTAVLAELRVELKSGETVVVQTDRGWRSTPSHILAADVIAGEVHDHRRRVLGWADPHADRSQWQPVRVDEHPFEVLIPATDPPTRRIEELAPIAIREVSPMRHVVDFGQNSNGWVRLSELGPAGTQITLTYGEILDEFGDVAQDNVARPVAAKSVSTVPFQTDVVTSAGDGAVFEPRHSTKGFRYVRVEGLPGPLEASSIASVVVHSDLRPIGGFRCSDERVNLLHAAADWSFRSNACEIPTDCPHRERAGWSGDWQVFVGTAAYLYDIYDFSVRWLSDLAAEQWEDGRVPNIVPDHHDFRLPEHARWRDAQGSAGWGDAACHVPWEMFLAFGRSEILERQFGSMRRWVDWAAGRAAEGRHESRVAQRPTPAAHERFIWDSGFHFGEWTEPDAPQGAELLRHITTMDHGPTATAFLHRSATEVAHAASVLGDHAASDRYGELAANVRAAWCAEFIDDGGRVRPQRQANLVRALAFGLVPEELRQAVAGDLVSLIEEADMHLGTGFLATPFLLPVLADNGHLDVAYRLLLQDTPPSWLFMIDQGATTIWEDWDGRASQNHYSKGAVISFLHRYVAGLQPITPGYRRFRAAPRPGGAIRSAETFHVSPQGRIELSWRIDAGIGQVDVTVPKGSEAEVVLPDGSSDVLGAGRHLCRWTPA